MFAFNPYRNRAQRWSGYLAASLIMTMSTSVLAQENDSQQQDNGNSSKPNILVLWGDDIGQSNIWFIAD
ncbi:hypothetical protein [Halomonas sp. BN3-1]|uniref:hypothetical protein n=1 Tax=Halomonas sp. BN3-1 TaxID=2082393 RepID=UPI000D3CF2CF|nr:hypothetical protein [Halomonas sp. BN3-1]